VAAVDWFASEVAAPAPARRPRPKPQSVPRARRRAQGVRLTGGILWISAFAVLLAGVVALNVAVLRVNMNVNDLSKQQADLQAQNQALSSRLSSAGSSIRIEQAARRLGLVPAPATDTSYVDLGGGSP
jgi:cell division protein FtsL